MTTSQRELHEALLAALPAQGHWSAEEYLWLTDHTTRPLEFTDGAIEVLPMPTDQHQVILSLLVQLFSAHLQPRGGVVLFAPLRLQLRPGKFREPDILVLRDARDPRRRNRYWLGADLVVEIASADNPERDLVEKRREYAEAGIPEYWIVNPLDETIGVLVLRDGAYIEHGPFARGMRVTSALFPDISVEVDAVFDAYYPADDDQDR
jgi:Uma2 family endonuclease